MDAPDYRDLVPHSEENSESYCSRLEESGHCEMFIRKALSTHFIMDVDEFGDFFENFPSARFRHIAAVRRLQRYNRPDTFERKIAGGLGISSRRAAHWIKKFQELDDIGPDL